LIVLDTSALFAALDRAEPMHERCAAVLSVEEGVLILSPFVLAELDYLLVRELGIDFELEVLNEVAAGTYELVTFDANEIAAAHELIARYRDLRIGLADASIVVLAGRYGTDRVLTLDERHFRTLRAPSGGPLTILPADA
jgi:uncharacterized protein